MAGERILLIDDEAGIRKMFRRHLEKAGYQVFDAGNCDEALELLQRQEVDLILLDIIMPKKDGVFCLGEIKKEYENIPIIMVTGVDNILTGVEVMKKGAFDYIVKPIKRDDLIKAIENAIKEKERIAQETKVEPFQIHYVVLLNNTGIAMYHKNLDPDFLLKDDDLIGSMFIALRMFINDSFRINGGLKEIDHGDYQILVEDGQNFFLAVIGKGEDIKPIREKMQRTINKIYNDYGTIINNWRGNMGDFDGIEKEFEELIV